MTITPTDHYVEPNERYLQHIRVARHIATRVRDLVVLLGVRSNEPDPDFGYIMTGEHLTDVPHARTAVGFVERPTVTHAEKLISGGALWNTMVTCGTVDVLWSLGRGAVPKLIAVRATYRPCVRGSRSTTVLAPVHTQAQGRALVKHATRGGNVANRERSAGRLDSTPTERKTSPYAAATGASLFERMKELVCLAGVSAGVVVLGATAASRERRGHRQQLDRFDRLGAGTAVRRRTVRTLPEADQALANQAALSSSRDLPIPGTTPVLMLLGSAGSEPAWNDRASSAAHRERFA